MSGGPILTNETVCSWEEFKSAVAKLRESTSQFSPYLFRGQSSSAWDIATTLERSQGTLEILEYLRKVKWIKPEIETYLNLKWSDGPSWDELDAMLNDYDPFSRELSRGAFPHYDYASFLRHHGFPSPLLDWSRSPFVASYFAFRRPVGEHVSIFAFCETPQDSKVRSSDAPQIAGVGGQTAAHRRHFAQQSQYTVCVQFSLAEKTWKFAPHSQVFDLPENIFEQDVLQKFTISVRERDRVLKELGDYNLNAFSLFGTEDSLMETLAIREGM
jgi:hypothetical protein